MTINPLDFNDLFKQQTKAGWQRMPSGTIIVHLHLYASKLEQTKDFYTKGLDFNIVSRYANQALFLSMRNYHHRSIW